MAILPESLPFRLSQTSLAPVNAICIREICRPTSEKPTRWFYNRGTCRIFPMPARGSARSILFPAVHPIST